MRSVLIHLLDTSRDAVRVHLAKFINPTSNEQWLYPARSAKKTALYVEFYDDLEREWEPDDVVQLKSTLGQIPDVILIAHVSTTVPGDAEIREFSEYLLGMFRGAAQDEYSNHCWTLSEIRSGAEHDGLKFFDYEGWHKSRSGG